MRLLLLISLAAWACGTDPGATDASPDDAAPRDGSIIDAGGPADAGGDDANGDDAAEPEDGGADAGGRDGGRDGGSMDASRDVGVIDAGPIDGGFLPTFTLQPIDDQFIHGQSVTLVDLDGDGDLDILSSISLDDRVALYLNGGNGASWTSVDVAARDTIVAMHAVPADFDGDGDLDVAAVGLFDRNVGFASPGEVTWYRNPGTPTGSWTEVPITGLTLWGARTAAAGDVSGDGFPDIIVGSSTSQDANGGEQGNGVRWFRNGGGSFSAPIAIDANLRHVEVVLIHDVDGNGVLDVIASGHGSSEIVWYENQRPPGTSQSDLTFIRRTIQTTIAPSGLALAQMDRDPELELFATSERGVFWLDPPADPRNAWVPTEVTASFGSGVTVRLTATDLNLDGRMDVVVSSFTGDAVRAYVDVRTGWTERIVQQPLTGATFVASGDIDRDGIPDLVTTTYGFDSSFDRLDWWRVRP